MPKPYEQIPYSKRLTFGEQLAVYREIKSDPKVSREKLARYYDTTVKEIKKAYLKGLMLKWR